MVPKKTVIRERMEIISGKIQSTTAKEGEQRKGRQDREVAKTTVPKDSPEHFCFSNLRRCLNSPCSRHVRHNASSSSFQHQRTLPTPTHPSACTRREIAWRGKLQRKRSSSALIAVSANVAEAFSYRCGLTRRVLKVFPATGQPIENYPDRWDLIENLDKVVDLRIHFSRIKENDAICIILLRPSSTFICLAHFCRQPPF
jgi:hypothetical protein